MASESAGDRTRRPPIPPRRPIAQLSALALLALLALMIGAVRPGAGQEASQPARQARGGTRVLHTGGLKLESAALLMSGQQGGQVPLAVLALPLPRGGQRESVTAVVEASGAALLAGGSANPVRLEVGIYAVTEAGGVAGAITDTVEIVSAGSAAPADTPGPAGILAEIGAGGLRFQGELQLFPGEYSLRVLVRNQGTKAFGLRVLPLTVPAFGAQGQGEMLLAPLFQPSPAGGATKPEQAPEGAAAPGAAAAGALPEAGGARSGAAAEPPHWVTVEVGARGEQALPAQLAGQAPEARPVLEPESEVSFELPVFHLAAHAYALRVQLSQPGGGVVADLPARSPGRHPTGRSSLELLDASFKARGLAAGAYELRVQLTAGELRLLSPPLTVLLAPAGAGQLWTSFAKPEGDAGGAGAAAFELSSLVPGRHFHGDVRVLAGTYRNALARLAAGDDEAARSALSGFEMQLMHDKEATIEDLETIEIESLRGIATAEPEALIPILHLYDLLYLESRANRRFQLSTHARNMYFALAGYYGEHSRDPGAKQRTARLLVVFGSALDLNAGNDGFSRRAYQQALALDRDNELALVGLAIIGERYGDYRAAADVLERALQVHPEAAEARLRLAVDLARLGERRRAIEQLESLIKTGAPGWTLAVAYQELGQLRIKARKLHEAERDLRQGLTAVPGDEKLTLALASVLDLEGKLAAAQETLAGLKPQPEGAEGPRLRYTRLPVDELHNASVALQKEFEERRVRLAAALKSTPRAPGRRG